MLQRERKEHRNDKGHKKWLKEKEENTEKQSKQRARKEKNIEGETIAVSEEERRKDVVLEREARDNQVKIQEEINKIRKANNSI